ncbi:MAG TPA: MlaD family protein [Spirochaetota bacterium]|nr:MCE family protein [Spirochaetota bacterium]OQA97268.1 MAG: mce related protein [Spirochaetes bacterium ADurb.Bin218]HOK01185.1 MlaD family protein [Spirochaetota bacterium]HOK91604.1 MlaD family protein [Spirochaetota bacterium]HON15048.1 MlaD family protein [Spirochaetota bacterium]
MKLSNEAKVGLMVIITFTIFIGIVALLARLNVASSGYKLSIYFGFLNDLKVGAPVNIAGGIEIGRVVEIRQSGEKTEVVVWIDNKYRLIKNTSFAIFTKGIIGSKYINVFVPPSTNVDDFLNDGDKVYGVDPPSFDQMMLIFQTFMNGQNGGELLAKIFQNSEALVENLNKIASENRGDVRQSILAAKASIILFSQQMKIFMDELNRFTSNVANLSEKNKEEINITIRNMSEISSNLNKIIQRLEDGRGSLGKLMTDEEIYYNIKDASQYAKELFGQLKQDPSKLFFKQK